MSLRKLARFCKISPCLLDLIALCLVCRIEYMFTNVIVSTNFDYGTHNGRMRSFYQQRTMTCEIDEMVDDDNQPV